MSTATTQRIPTTDSTAPTVWWQRLRGVSGDPLPLSVAERMNWYAGQVRRHRILNYTLEIVIIVLAASIPAATTLGASAVVAGVLGAVVTALAGLRQVLRSQENWIRCSGTLVALQREAVLWGSGNAPYDDNDSTQVLVANVEALVAQETAQWTQQRESSGSGKRSASVSD
jgi:hypothetical protein